MPGTALPLAAATPAVSRHKLVRRATALAWLGIAWHAVEATVAVAAGVVAGSVALVGFGADSLIEGLAGFVLLWRFSGARAGDEEAERRAQQLIALTFYALALYVGAEAIRSLAVAGHPDPSPVGIALSLVTLATMPLLARAKAGVGAQL